MNSKIKRVIELMLFNTIDKWGRMENTVTYKIVTDLKTVRDKYITLDLSNLTEENSYNFASRMLKYFFREYKVKINHVAKTVRVEKREA